MIETKRLSPEVDCDACNESDVAVCCASCHSPIDLTRTYGYWFDTGYKEGKRLAAPADQAVVTEAIHMAIGGALHRHLDVADMDTDAYDRMIADIAEAALRAERGEGDDRG